MTKIAMVLEGEDGQIFPSIEGVANWVGEKKDDSYEFKGEQITAKKQFVLLVDGDDKVGVELTNKPEFFKGDKVVIKSIKGNHGLQGVKVRTYNDKKTGDLKKVVSVTGSANVEFLDRPNGVASGANPKSDTSPWTRPTRRVYTFEERITLYDLYFDHLQSQAGSPQSSIWSYTISRP